MTETGYRDPVTTATHRVYVRPCLRMGAFVLYVRRLSEVGVIRFPEIDSDCIASEARVSAAPLSR